VLNQTLSINMLFYIVLYTSGAKKKKTQC